MGTFILKAWLSLTNDKELLRPHSLKSSNTRIAENCACAQNVVISTVQQAQEKEIAWITAHANAYRFFGSATRILTPDNL